MQVTLHRSTRIATLHASRYCAIIALCLAGCSTVQAYSPPVYPGATLISRGQDGSETELIYETSDPPQNVLNFYRTVLSEEGWDVGDEIGGRIESWATSETPVSLHVINVRVMLARDGATHIEIRTIA